MKHGTGMGGGKASAGGGFADPEKRTLDKGWQGWGHSWKRGPPTLGGGGSPHGTGQFGKKKKKTAEKAYLFKGGAVREGGSLKEKNNRGTPRENDGKLAPGERI